MRIVGVKFGGSSRVYEYKTNLGLIVGGTYNIVADGETTYSTPVTVVSYKRTASCTCPIRTITAATCVNAPARPDSNIQNVIFNEEKRTTLVIWKDGVKTLVKCDPRDTWNKEAALALCYMKRAHQNRGCFNETLKRFCAEGK